MSLSRRARRPAARPALRPLGPVPAAPLGAALLALALGAGSLRAQGMAFENATRASGLGGYRLAQNGPTATVGDVDGDGWLDVCVCGGSIESPRIFRNLLGDRPGSAPQDLSAPRRPWFKDVTSDVLIAEALPASIALFADIDRDGDQDLVAVERIGGNHRNVRLAFYENEGGRYVRLHRSDLGEDDTVLGGLAIADVDGDGRLDIVLGHNGGGNGVGGPGFYLRQTDPGPDGFPTFRDDTALYGGGLSHVRRYWSLVLADFDGDLMPELHCAIDGGFDFHCQNVAGGTFVDVSMAAGTTNFGSDMGLAVGDPDLDGDLDIYSTNIQYGVLYVNDGQGGFTNQAGQRGCGGYGSSQASVGWGTAFCDLDLDRDEDLVVVAYGAPGPLWENTGAGSFQTVPGSAGLVLSGHGLVPFDADRDGDLDLLIVAGGTDTVVQAWENVTPRAGRHWLEVDPIGTTSNTDGVGARVEVTAGGQTMLRAILNGSSFKSGPPTEAHFGLGTAATADVRIVWPSGAVQELQRVKADQVLRVREP